MLGFRAFTSKHELTVARDLWGEKGLEINLGRHDQWNWIDFTLRVDRACDHAGLHFELELVGFYLYFQIYDGRHWNYKAKRYYLDGEEAAEHANDSD